MKIAVAMSGGVDSTAAAVILQEKGNQVAGFTMQHYDSSIKGITEDDNIKKDIDDARKVCRKLKIPHYVIKLQNRFQTEVIDNFINQYKKGFTPNPCVICNPTIKWGAFIEAITKKFDFDKIATGHYAKIELTDDKIHLYKAEDRNKDQSYMLWKLNQKQLSHTLFPLGNLTKDEVRGKIKNLGIATHDRKESQDICFIAEDYTSFLENYFEFKPGKIRYIDGKIIGKHKGISHYTIGQRKGLETSLNKPLYVMEIDIAANEIVVSDEISDLERKTFEIYKVNWLQKLNFDGLDNIKVKIRYNSKELAVQSIVKSDKNLEIKLCNPVKAITPGQSAVFYRKDELIGGGIIIK